MKVIFIILTFFVSVNVAFTQTIEAPVLPIDWSDTTVFVPKQTDFYLGYHWMENSRKTMSSLLHINHYDRILS